MLVQMYYFLSVAILQNFASSCGTINFKADFSDKILFL